MDTKGIEKVLETVAWNVVTLRKQLGLTQEDLAFKADIDRTYVGYIENAKQNISTKKLHAIARALQVTIPDLLKPETTTPATMVAEPNAAYGTVEMFNTTISSLLALQKSATQLGVATLFQDDALKILQVLLVTGLSDLSRTNGLTAADINGTIYAIRTLDLLQTKDVVLHDHLTPQLLKVYKSYDWIFGIYRGIEMVALYQVTSKDVAITFTQWESKGQKSDQKTLKNLKISLKQIREIGKVLFEGDGSGKIRRVGV